MKLDWMMFANHAEENGGLLYMTGAGWDTITVQAPVEGASPDVVAAMQGMIVIRMLFHATETDREHGFTIVLMDEDGAEQARVEGQFRVERNRNTPVGWEQGVNVIGGLTGLPLKRFGNYTFSLQVDGQHLGDRPFRVLRGY